MWTYLLAGLAVLAGLLFLYTLCLKAAENDWTVGERTPPGPLHLPLIGSLASVLGAGPVGPWLSSLVTSHGQVVRCCVPGQKIVIVREDQAKKENGAGGGIRLDHRSLQDVTLDHLVSLVKKLGSKVNPTDAQLEGCSDLARVFYNFTVTLDDFAALMKSAENYRLALHQKKISSLLEKLLKREVAFGETEKDLVEEAFGLMEKLKGEVARSSPALWLPLTCHSPRFFFHRKRLSTLLAKLANLLSQMFHRCGGDPEISDFEQFLLVYLAIGLSTTSPSRKPSSRSRTSDMKTGCNQDSVVSMASPSVESFDIIGLRFYSTLDYLTVGSFDIPGNCLIITQANATSLTLSP